MFNERLAVMLDDSNRFMGVSRIVYTVAEFFKTLKEIVRCFVCLLVFVIK